MTSQELRQSFLGFFEERGHKVLPSASLVPRNDPTLLLTGAGMVPFKPYFLGKETSPYQRITTCQRCVRTPDIDNVGKTARHATFFEMLGNFSLGDYFKEDAIAWGWEFVTRCLRLPEERLWVTIYLDDDEAFRIWNENIGVPADRIQRLGKKDNFWEIGVGPCGPCSEIHIDRGEDYGCGRPDCGIECECDRFLEIWNLVFIQFHRDEQGNYIPLPKKSIDTGMGLERTVAVMNGARTIFDIDVTGPIVGLIAELAGKRYGASEDNDISMRIITDHLRGVTFMAADGVLPSNEGRGYVLRRILRRAIRHGRLLGIAGPFATRVSDLVIDLMREAYPETDAMRNLVAKVVSAEEERFSGRLDQGMELLGEIIQGLKEACAAELPGEEAFRLYDTFGFPLELTREIAAEAGIGIDDQGFEGAMERQRERARAARQVMGYLGSDSADRGRLFEELPTRFVGYETPSCDATVLAIVSQGERVGKAAAGDRVEVVLDLTPFYAESGGQVSDTGELEGVATGAAGAAGGAAASVVGVRKGGAGNTIIHACEVKSGTLTEGQKVTATVAVERRRAIMRNHTTTHLLHAALRSVLGQHAQQAGSLVSDDRLRFDFTHPAGMTPDEVRRVEDEVNRSVLEDVPVRTELMSMEEAMRAGAIALFDEKYGEDVRVVTIGSISKELCGGTHLERTGQAGMFRIVSEAGIAGGVRRIEAVTGLAALERARDADLALECVATYLKVPVADVAQRVYKLVGDLKAHDKHVQELTERLARGSAAEIVASPLDVHGVKVFEGQVDGLDPANLRRLGDRVRERVGSGVILLGSRFEGRALFLAMVTPDLAGAGLHAGKLVKEAAEAAGGGGGGRPDMAQAGGRDASKLGLGLLRAREAVAAQVSAGSTG